MEALLGGGGGEGCWTLLARPNPLWGNHRPFQDGTGLSGFMKVISRTPSTKIVMAMRNHGEIMVSTFPQP